MNNIRLKIEGMHCTGCSTRLEKILNNLKGVKEARVSFDAAIADIKFDEAEISSEEIKLAIEDAGFKGE